MYDAIVKKREEPRRIVRPPECNFYATYAYSPILLTRPFGYLFLSLLVASATYRYTQRNEDGETVHPL